MSYGNGIGFDWDKYEKFNVVPKEEPKKETKKEEKKEEKEKSSQKPIKKNETGSRILSQIVGSLLVSLIGAILFIMLGGTSTFTTNLERQEELAAQMEEMQDAARNGRRVLVTLPDGSKEEMYWSEYIELQKQYYQNK